MKSKRFIWLAAAALIVTGGTSVELLAQNQQKPANEQRQPRQNTNTPDRANAQRPGAPGANGGIAGRGMDQLNLTEQQKQKMAQIREKYKAQMQQLRNSNLTPEQKRERSRQLMEAQQKEIKAVLTPEQNKKLEEWQKNRPAPRAPRVDQPRSGANRPDGQGQRPSQNQGQTRTQSGGTGK